MACNSKTAGHKVEWNDNALDPIDTNSKHGKPFTCTVQDHLVSFGVIVPYDTRQQSTMNSKLGHPPPPEVNIEVPVSINDLKLQHHN